MVYKVYGDELYHHGILGQKWGVRRYQNPDGSLTPAGRERYGYGNGNSGKSGSKTYSKTDPNHKLGSYEQEKKTAEKVGKSALDKFEELYEKYDKGEIPEEQYYEQLQKQVYDPIIEAGFDWVSRSIGLADGYKHLQFGRDLSDLEIEERNGEEWVQEWLIANDWPGIIDMNKEYY